MRSPRPSFVRGLVALFVLSAGCAPATEIWVDVHTDLVPGEELDRVVVNLDDGTSRSFRVSAGVPFLETARRFGPLPTGSGRRRVTVDLERSGAIVLTRSISGNFEGTVVLTVWLTRACLGVTCPTAADPLATECDDGECVRPDCAADPAGCIAPRCSLDTECTIAAPACAANACVGGRCTLIPNDAVCLVTEYCNPEIGCTPRSVMTDAGNDAGALDAGSGPLDAGLFDGGFDAGPPDAGPPPPPYRLMRLPEGSMSWTTVTTTGAGPSTPVLAAFSSGSTEIIALTSTEFHALRVSDHRWVARAPRSSEFPELDSVSLYEADALIGIAPRILMVVSREGSHEYDWDGATRTATPVGFTAFASFPIAEWGSPLAPAWWQVAGVYTRPDDRGGWVTPSAGDACPTGPPGVHQSWLSWDGFGPRAMLVSSYDFACFRFVDETIYASFEPFMRSSAPSDEYAIEAVTWIDDSLYVFTN